jgi:hypothetical protein
MKPFKPKSTTYMTPGQYWSIPISNDRFGCGIVLSLIDRIGTVDGRMFLAGLIEWIGDSAPVPMEIANRPISAKRFAHINMILMTGGELIGEVSPWWECEKPMPFTDDILIAGYNVFSILAEKQASAHV